MNQVKIGMFIAKLRKEKNITQEDLAEKIGVNSKSISRWENGRCMPDLSILKPLSKELGISLNELLSGEKLEKITKLNSDQIIDTSIKNYTKIEKQKSIKIIVMIIIINIILIPIFILSINQLRKDKIGDSVGTSWSSLYTRYYSNKFFKALEDNNYNELENLLEKFNFCYNHESREDYINKLKELQEFGVQFIDHEYHSTWLSDKDWPVGYRLKIKYQDTPVETYANIEVLVGTIVNDGKVTNLFPIHDYKIMYFNETIWSQIIEVLSYCSYKL